MLLSPNVAAPAVIKFPRNEPPEYREGMLWNSSRNGLNMSLNRVEWQHRRSRLNHDWLKNWLMPALSKLLRVAKGQIADQQYFAELSARLRREWPGSASEFEALALGFRGAMSPASYFDEEPLLRLPPEEAEWMRQVTHQLWLNSFPVEELTHGVIEALKTANDSCTILISALEDRRSVGLVDKIEHFQRACKALGDAVSELPAKPEFSRRPHG